MIYKKKYDDHQMRISGRKFLPLLMSNLSSIAVSAILFVLFYACTPEQYRSADGAVFGTVYHIVYKSDQDLSVEIKKELDRVDGSLSMFNPASVISRLNRNEGGETDDLFRLVFQKSMEVYQRTSGAFDITVAPLTHAWGFGYKSGTLPTAEQIDSVRQWVGMDKVMLQGERLVKTHDSIQMDASAIAKGLGVDVVAEMFEAKGVENYLVEIGGEVRAKGINEQGRVWRIGIDLPLEPGEERTLSDVVALSGGALATSGNYRNFRVRNGEKYGHTINPATGYPVRQKVLSASVYAPTCMEADAYATAFMVMEMEETIRLVKAHPCLEVYLICRNDNDDYELFISEGFNDLILKSQ